MDKLKHIAFEYGTQALIVLAGISLILLVNNLAGHAPHPLEQKPAPVFSLSSLDGALQDIESSMGKEVVVLDFFATWCPPCVKGLPVVDAIGKEFEGQGVKVFAVNVGEDRDTVAAFVKAKSLNLNVLLDESGEVSDEYGVQSIPQTVVIGKDGIIQSVHIGVGYNFEGELRADILKAITPQ